MKTFAVIGGGITGLAVARVLSTSESCRVVLLEAESRLGGKIRTDEVDGVVVEAGPDSFVARDALTMDLCESLGLAVIEPAVFGACIWSKDKLRRLPRDFTFGIPSSLAATARSRLLSPRGVLGAARDLVLPGPLTGADVSVGAFVRRRFGTEVLERLVDAVLAGTRAGRADDMSLAAALPQIDTVARRHRSVMRGLRRARRAGEIAPPRFVAVDGGMQRLVERLERDLRGRVELRTSTSVAGIHTTEDGYALDVGGETVSADGVVVTAPAYAAEPLVRPLSDHAAAELAAIGYASVAAVTLIYPPGTRPVPTGTSGLLVPSGERRTLAACTWFSVKWPHLAPSDGRIVLRCFVGRAGQHPALELDDRELAERVATDVAEMLRWDDRPLSWSVARWERSIPQYAVGHLERVARLERALSDHPRVVVAGAAYRGSGLPDCIEQAHAAAARLLEVTDRARVG